MYAVVMSMISPQRVVEKRNVTKASSLILHIIVSCTAVGYVGYMHIYVCVYIIPGSVRMIVLIRILYIMYYKEYC